MALAQNAVAVTPTDGLTVRFDALFVGGAGDVAIKDKDGTASTWTVPAGGYVRCKVTEVLSTGTTATGIIGLLI